MQNHKQKHYLNLYSTIIFITY